MIGDTASSASNLQDAEKSRRLNLEHLQLSTDSNFAKVITQHLPANNRPSTWIKMANRNMPDDVQEPRLENTAHPTEGDDRADGQPSPTTPDVVPLFQIIDEFMADYPVLQELVTRRFTRACLVSDSRRDVDLALARMRPLGTWGLYLQKEDLKLLLQRIDELGAQDHAVLIIEDIDAELYHKLCARFSSSIDAEFLAQHVLRSADLKSTIHSDHRHIEDILFAYEELEKQVRAKFSRTDSASSNRQQRRGHHLHGTINSLPQTTPRVALWLDEHSHHGYR
jgi:hypothetical protein